MSVVRSGARVLADQLLIQGVNHLFCVPGESAVPVLDALIGAPGLRVVVNRHESGSTFMACGYARLTGQPGIAYVSRGPGACNAAIGIHSAHQDSLPVVLLVGQSPTAFLEPTRSVSRPITGAKAAPAAPTRPKRPAAALP